MDSHRSLNSTKRIRGIGPSAYETAKDSTVMKQYKEQSNKITDGLDKLITKGDNAKVRWIWELIQNAKDASLDQENVKIMFIQKASSVQFIHSGDPFTNDNLLSLIN